MARGLQDQIVVLARHDTTGIELARREPVAHGFEQRLAALARVGLAGFRSFFSHSDSFSSRRTARRRRRPLPEPPARRAALPFSMPEAPRRPSAFSPSGACALPPDLSTWSPSQADP